MSAQRSRPQLQSLAAWLTDLGPGDPCPWCGARLEAAAAPARLVGLAPVGAGAHARRPTVVCRECGCEMTAVDDVAEAGCRILHDAA